MWSTTDSGGDEGFLIGEECLGSNGGVRPLLVDDVGLFLGGGGLRLLELSLRETEDELKDLDREREREREPEAEEDPEYDEEPDIDPDGLARRGLPDLAMPLPPLKNWKPYPTLTF